MYLRTLCMGLVLLTLVLTSGCHSNQSRYGACYAQPTVVASPGCNTCNTPPPPAPVAAVPGF